MAVKKHRSTIFFVKRSLESAVASAWTAVTGSHRLVAVAVVGVVGGLAGAAYVVLLRLLSVLVWSADRPLAGQAVVLLGAVYRQEGFLVRAEATLTRALEQNPGDAAARRELSLVREDRGAALPPQRHGWADWVMRHVGRAR